MQVTNTEVVDVGATQRNRMGSGPAREFFVKNIDAVRGRQVLRVFVCEVRPGVTEENRAVLANVLVNFVSLLVGVVR